MRRSRKSSEYGKEEGMRGERGFQRPEMKNRREEAGKGNDQKEEE